MTMCSSSAHPITRGEQPSRAAQTSPAQPDELVCIEPSIRLLERLREVYDGPIGVHAKNTEARFGITALPDYYHIAPGWISTSRDDCCPVSRIAGNTALNANSYKLLRITGRMPDGLVLQLDSQSCSAQTSGLPC